MLQSSKVAKFQKYRANVQALDSDYKINVDLIKVDTCELLSIDNPYYDILIQKYQYLKPVNMHDDMAKVSLLVHLVLYRKR